LVVRPKKMCDTGPSKEDQRTKEVVEQLVEIFRAQGKPWSGLLE
jgi:hypothetical protein